MSRGPSAHLTWSELSCRDAGSTVYPEAWRDTRAVLLGQAFEAVRHALGGYPLTILSGYRTPAHNRAVCGAKHSQHLQGRALDIEAPWGMPVDQMGDIVLMTARTTCPIIRGVGIYKAGGFVHIDVRPGAHLAVWHGRRKTTA